MIRILFIIFYLMIGLNPLNAFDDGTFFTYPSIARHDNRYWNNTRFLYEKQQPPKGAGDLDCLNDAVRTLPYSMPYYSYYVNVDTKIITNMDNVPNDVGVVIFSHFLTEESELSASGGYTSPVLYLSSLLKIMCPKIKTRTGYDRKNPKAYYDYVLFQYER